MKYYIFVCLVSFLALPAFSQTDSITNNNTATESSFVSETKPTPQLLPEKYLLTQRLLWSEHGLMRAIPGNELNETNRMREVKWRSNMLKAHRLLGYATILGMIGQAYTGAKLYNTPKESKEYDNFKGLHSGFAGYTTATYFTSGGLMLFAPPWTGDRAPGYSNTKLHKYLSMVHMSCMIASLITADGAGHPGFIRDFHRATAYAAFGTYFISTVIIHF
jgi:hypothetical protein